ncbi:MAG: hypothetical protein AB1403_14255 [Candidatus Riflebacteria bacterium]
MKRFINIVICSLLAAIPWQLLADQIDDNSINEAEKVEMLSDSESADRFTLDPFKPLIRKKETIIKKVKEDKPSEIKIEKKEEKPFRLPEITITGICGNDKLRQAIMLVDKNEVCVSKDQIVDGIFKIIEIENDSVTIYSFKNQQRLVIKFA